MILPDLAYDIEMNKRNKILPFLLIIALCMLMLLAAGCQQKENESEPVSQQLFNGKVFASDEDFAYFTAGNALFRWEKGSEQVEKLSDTFSADFMQLYGNSLYYTIYLTGELRVYDLKTGKDSFLGQMWDTPSADYNGSFWIDEDRIYCLSYTESGQPAVQVLSLEGTPKRTIPFAHQTPFPFWVEDRTLYYAARLDNREH